MNEHLTEQSFVNQLRKVENASGKDLLKAIWEFLGTLAQQDYFVLFSIGQNKAEPLLATDISSGFACECFAVAGTTPEIALAAAKDIFSESGTKGKLEARKTSWAEMMCLLRKIDKLNVPDAGILLCLELEGHSFPVTWNMLREMFSIVSDQLGLFDEAHLAFPFFMGSKDQLDGHRDSKVPARYKRWLRFLRNRRAG